MALTAKQRLFVDEYLIDLNATQAAIRAGYSAKTARQIGEENLSKPDIKDCVERRMKDREKRTEITQDFVLQTILETVQRCRQVSPVLDRAGNQVYVETPNGEEAPAFEFDAKNVLKGLELLGKHLKVFSDKDEIDAELKRVELEKRKVELERLKSGDGFGDVPPSRVEVTVVDARKRDADA